MTERTDAEDERHEQALPECAPSPDISLPLTTVELEQHGDQAPEATSVQPVMLLRYRPGVVGETARTVHLVPLPPAGQADAAGVTLCGAVLFPDQVKRVTPGLGVPCSLCLLSQASAVPHYRPPPSRSSL